MNKPTYILAAMIFVGSLLASPRLFADDDGFFSLFKQQKPPAPVVPASKSRQKIQKVSDQGSDEDDVIMPPAPVNHEVPNTGASAPAPASQVAVPVSIPAAPAAPPIVKKKPAPPLVIVHSEEDTDVPPPRPPANIPEVPQQGSGKMANGVPLLPPPVIQAQPIEIPPPKPDDGNCHPTISAAFDPNQSVNIKSCMDVIAQQAKQKIEETKNKIIPPVCAPLPNFPAPNTPLNLYAINTPTGFLGGDLKKNMAPGMGKVQHGLEDERQMVDGCPSDCIRINQPIVYVDLAPGAATRHDDECPDTPKLMTLNRSEVQQRDSSLTVIKGSVAKIYDSQGPEILADVGDWTGSIAGGTSSLGSYMSGDKQYSFGKCPSQCSFKSSIQFSEKDGPIPKTQVAFEIRCGPPRAVDLVKVAVYVKNNWSCKAK